MAESSDFKTFLKWEATTNNTIDFKTVYVDIAGDLVAGLMLSQIIYWYLPDKSGGTKLRVERNGHYWMVKSRAEWWEECRLTGRQVDLALAKLRQRGLIETARFKFGKTPTTHIRLLHENFMRLWQAALDGTLEPLPDKRRGNSRNANLTESEFDEMLNSQNVDAEFDETLNSRKLTKRQIPLTETTAETPTETTGGGGRRADAPPPAPDPPPKPKRHTRAEPKTRDPLLDHPAVMSYRDEAHYTPPATVRPDIAGAVGDAETDLAFWRQVVHAWVAAGWNQRNVGGMLDCYRRREIPGKGPRASPSGNGRKPKADTSGIDQWLAEKRAEAQGAGHG